MSSTIIDSPDAGTIDAAAPDVDAPPHHRLHRAWLVTVAVVAAITLGLTLAWQAAAGTSGPSTAASGSTDASAADVVPGVSTGAGLLALAWELAPPSQHEAACAQFAADPGAAWVAYSSAAQDVATRAEFTAFFSAAC
jgi:hypothetical protein